MRRDTSKPQVGFSGYLPRAEKQTLLGKLPMHGGPKFFVVTALEHFLDVVESSPALQDAVHQSILQMLGSESDPPAGEKLDVRIPTPLYERYIRIFPDRGFATWFLRRIVRQFALFGDTNIESEIQFSVNALLEEVTGQTTT